jgi:hypothetical protein
VSERPLRIFVSYRRGDGGHAGRLYDSLAARFGRDNIFMDIDTIDPGVDFAEVINRAVTACDVVIALIGREWVGATDAKGHRRLDNPDDFVRLELESALARPDVFVIPTCVQATEIPSPQELPPSLAPLARRQGIELRDVAWHDDVGRLIRRLERLAVPGTGEATPDSIERKAVPAAALPTHRARRSRKWLVALGVVLTTIAIAVVAAALALSGSDGEGGEETQGGPAGLAESRLLAVIPPVTRPSCQRIDYGAESAELSLECSGVRLAATYHSFSGKDALSDWYLQRRELAEISPGSGSCTSSAFRGEARYTVGGRAVGRYFCLVDSEGAELLVWTDTRINVGSEANVYEGEGRAAVESLLRQWRCCLQLQP